MIIHNSSEDSESVTGFFDSPDDAEEVVEQLYSLGLTAQQISTTTGESPSGQVAPSARPISVSAAVGAALGGLFGAFLGWAIAVGAVVLPGVTSEALPGVGTTVGSAVAVAMLTALLFGAGIGALIGSLVASGARSGVVDRQGGVLITAHPPSDLTSRTADILRVNGATSTGLPRAVSETAPTALPASLFTSSEKENDIMAEDQVGRDPNSLTGTKGAFDPETGAYGTAGTPLTTGYGVSGSTVGIGSEAGEETHVRSDFKGSTPNSMAYETGGRSSTDDLGDRLSPDTGPSVLDKNSDIGRQEEASIPIEPEERDIYEQMPGYAENLKRTPGVEVTSTDADVEANSEAAPSERRNASGAGIIVERAADIQGPGNNTDTD